MKKILVIDDEADIVELVKNRLESDHYLVITACDGDDGLKKLNAEKPDLIILDIGMPQVDGYTFIRELKSNHELKPVPVIILTARDQMQDLFKVEGVVDYITKPFTAEKLLEKVRELIGN